MKNILLAFLLISSVSHAQATFHIAATTSTKAKGIIDGGAGYKYKSATLEGSIISPVMDQREDHPAYFSANAGYAIELGESISITPLLGAAYRMESVDKTELNGFVPAAGMRMKFKDVYVGATYMDKTAFLSIGIWYWWGE